MPKSIDVQRVIVLPSLRLDPPSTRCIRRGHIKILDRLRFSPPPRDPRRRQRKNAILVLQSAFSNDLCGHVGDFRRAAGVDVEIFGF